MVHNNQCFSTTQHSCDSDFLEYTKHRMCLWILTACLGVAGAPQPYYGYGSYGGIVAGGPPPPIILPTVAPPIPTVPPPTPPPTVPPPTPPPTLPTLPPLTPAPTLPTLPPLTPAPTRPTLPPLTPVPTLPTLPPLTPVPTLPTLPPVTPVPTPPTGLPTFPTLPPTGQQTIPTAPPTATVRPTFPPLTPAPPGLTQASPLIDPRLQTPAFIRDTETLFKFGGEDIDYKDVVIELPNDIGSMSFPRDKRQAPVVSVPSGCGCYFSAQCGTTSPNTDGTGLIDFRIVVGGGSTTCPAGFSYCCLPTNSGQQSCGSRLTGTTAYPTAPGQARYGDYPWMAAIMTTTNQYVGGGVMIDTQNVLTTAHRISPYPNGVGLKIRLGEWDGSGNYEQYPYRDFTIARVWVHESFNPNTLQNDLAVVRLTGGVPAGTPALVPICLPAAGQSFEGQRCWVSGWGKDAFGVNGQYQSILRAVDVPIIASGSCETTLRTTRLGTAYLLDRSAFICAGGEANKDACTGDGGSGLVCETTPGRWTLAGLVAWGLGCATPGYPAAYVNVPNYMPWITARQATPA